MAGRNPLSTRRSKDQIYEGDSAKETKERGNQTPYDSSALRRNTIILFIFAFCFCYVMFGFLIGFCWSMIHNTLAESPIIGDIFKVKHQMEIKDGVYTMLFGLPHLIVTAVFALLAASGAAFMNAKYGKRQALTEDHTDINTYEGDRHILKLEELATTYAVYPDAGAVSKTISPSSIIGHVFFSNSGKLNKVKLAKRDQKTGEILKDENGQTILESLPMFDDDVRDFAFQSVGIKDKKSQKEKTIDPFKLKYKKNKKGKWITVGDFIKEDWYIPEYENQRPTGAFFVETSAVNTIAIAITRGNKGQLIVNNTIDNLSREGDPQNMFINDPKGELFAGFHKLLELRGIEPVVLNLMEPSKTHQFNVLGPAIMFARIGDYDQMRSSLNTVMNTFFPVEGDDPFWGNAQQTLVRMIIFALMDYYIEEEREYLQLYAGKKDASTITRELDEMWSHVTMFNVYQMLTTMSRNEVSWKPNTFELQPDKEETDNDYDGGESESQEEGEQLTQLTAFLKLLDKLPQNKMRTIAMQQSDAMDVMAESEKTRATVYGIALVAMLFFTDGPITAITCASPRQTLDPMSLAFPRRLRFKVNQSFLKEHALVGRKVIFESFRDPQMKDKIEGDDFAHETKLDSLGWVEYRFKGIYDEYEEEKGYDGSISKIAKPIYVRMKIVNNKSKITMYTFDFEFKRGFAKTVDGKRFVINPRTNERIEQGGTLRLGKVRRESKEGYLEEIESLESNQTFIPRMNTMIQQFDDAEKLDESTSYEEAKAYVSKLINESDLPEKNWFEYDQTLKRLPNGMKVLPIEQTDAVYNVRPKAIFSITPPHLTDYIKIVIMMVAVLFDTSVGESYLTKASGKPFYKTRSVLDELGNMQFNGNGIPAFQTKLSIGLGQGQEYTMILQTLQQLRDVYGESVDKIVSSNTAVFIYLISNDTDMLEDLSKQAGSTHTSRTLSKNVTKKVGTMWDTLDDNVSYNYTTQEERLFTIDKLLSLTNGEAMVLSSVHRADNSGEAVRPNPIYNTDKTIMPMAYALHSKGHNHDFFKTAVANAEVATSSSGQDVYQTIPDFNQMYEKREKQARLTQKMLEAYKKQHNLSDQDLIRRDVNTVSESIMRLINATLNEEKEIKETNENMSEAEQLDLFEEAEEKNEALDDDERQILHDNEFNVNQVYKEVKDSKVQDKDKIYQDDIKKSKEKSDREEQYKHQPIYLDNMVSFNDLRNNARIYELLEQSMDDAVKHEDDINENRPYKLEYVNNTQVIRHTRTKEVLFEYYRSDEENGAVNESWVTLDAFKRLVLNTAQQSSINVTNDASSHSQNVYMLSVKDVNDLFNIDKNSIISNDLPGLLQKEDFNNER